MVHMMETIRRAERQVDAKVERVAARHPFLSFWALTVGGPLAVLLLVGLTAAAAVLPLSWLLGWR